MSILDLDIKSYMKISWILIIIFFFIFTGCGDQLETSTKDESVNITSDLLDGTWTSTCNENTDETTSNKTSIIFYSNVDNITVTTTNYSDLNCSSESFVFKKILDNFVLGSKITTNQNQIINKFTAKVDNITIEPKSSTVTSTLNFHTYCGISGWAIDNATSVVGLSCESTTYNSKNDVHNDIIQMSSEKTFIRMGNITNTDNSNGYPKTLYSEEYFK